MLLEVGDEGLLCCSAWLELGGSLVQRTGYLPEVCYWGLLMLAGTLRAIKECLDACMLII